MGHCTQTAAGDAFSGVVLCGEFNEEAGEVSLMGRGFGPDRYDSKWCLYIFGAV